MFRYPGMHPKTPENMRFQGTRDAVRAQVSAGSPYTAGSPKGKIKWCAHLTHTHSYTSFMSGVILLMTISIASANGSMAQSISRRHSHSNVESHCV